MSEAQHPADRPPRITPGGLVHAYQKYDPKAFPSPTAPPPDLAGAAFEHMLEFGSLRDLSPEELARAVRLDPSMFPRLGPSLASLRAMLEERKRKILQTYETAAAQSAADQTFRDEAAEVSPPREHMAEFQRAVRQEQIADLERLWYRQKREGSPFAKELLSLMETLGIKYQVDELASKYAFSGKTELSPEEALEVKAELEAIDKLLEQLKTAEQTAQLAIIDMEDLAQFAEPGQIEELNQLQQMIEDYLKEEAQRQGLDETRRGFQLSPKAYRLFQRRLLTEIFADLQAARSGRHSGTVIGEGAVELQKTRPYAFGDSAAHMDVAGTIINAAARASTNASPLRPGLSDIDVHLTRNTPRCATVVCMDMSGSMRFDGQYINCKRMGLALDGLIASEYPGDFLSFVEVFSTARRRHVSELAALMPKPVSIRAPVVRLKADLSDPRVSTAQLPQHFTNLQHGLQLARQMLQVQDTPNRQIILITDGLPTAHFEGSELFLLYPPDPRTEEATMREARLCQREGITINIFLLPNWSQGSEDIAFAHRLAQQTRGRVFFTGGRDLDRYVLWDYVAQRRRIIG
jgi:uncharacterized protein with von Willebrand factor type A (vWA) domain